MGVLGALTREGGVSHRELAARLGVTPATLTPVVEALATAGHLTRERDPADRRVVRLSVTRPGRERHAAAAVAVEAVVRARVPEPSAADAVVVRAYLRSVLEGR
jgi:DNA-binding MarR family transcriptional regulator